MSVCVHMCEGEAQSWPGEPAQRGADTEAILFYLFFYHFLLSWAQGLSGASSFSQGINKGTFFSVIMIKNNNN